MHNLGDEHISGGWFTNPDQKEVRAGIKAAFDADKETNGLIFGPIKFEVLERSNSRVPAPHPSTPLTAKFLVGSAKIVAFVEEGTGSITDDLEKRDLEKLRDMTQKIWRKTNPLERELKTKELDMVIDRHGVEVIERMLSEG